MVKIMASNLKLSVSKCNFGEVEVEYLGTMTFDMDHLSILKDQVQTLGELPTPT